MKRGGASFEVLHSVGGAHGLTGKVPAAVHHVRMGPGGVLQEPTGVEDEGDLGYGRPEARSSSIWQKDVPDRSSGRFSLVSSRRAEHDYYMRISQ